MIENYYYSGSKWSTLNLIRRTLRAGLTSKNGANFRFRQSPQAFWYSVNDISNAPIDARTINLNGTLDLEALSYHG